MNGSVAPRFTDGPSLTSYRSIFDPPPRELPSLVKRPYQGDGDGEGEEEEGEGEWFARGKAFTEMDEARRLFLRPYPMLVNGMAKFIEEFYYAVDESRNEDLGDRDPRLPVPCIMKRALRC